MFKLELLPWLGAFKCLILTTNERVGLSLHWLEVFKGGCETSKGFASIIICKNKFSK